MFTPGLSRLNECMIFLQCPGREIFIHRENKTSVGRFVVEEFFEFDGVFILNWNKRLDLRPDLLLCFPKRHTAIDKDNGRIRYGIDGWCLNQHITNSDLAMTQKFVITKLRFQVADAGNYGKQFIDRIVAQVIRCSMCRLALGSDLHFKATLMSAIDEHFCRLTNDNKIRFDLGIHFNKCIGRDAVTPLFHIPKVIRGPSL